MTRKLDRAQRQYDNQVPDDYYESDDALALRAYRELEASLPEEVEDFADLLHAYKQGLKREKNAKRRYERRIEKLKAAVQISLMHIQAGVPQFIKRYRFAFERLLGSGEPIGYKDHYIDDLAEIERLKTEIKRLHTYAGKLLGTDPAMATVEGCVDAAVTYISQLRNDIARLKLACDTCTEKRIVQSLRRELMDAEVTLERLIARAASPQEP